MLCDEVAQEFVGDGEVDEEESEVCVCVCMGMCVYVCWDVV